jgi:hypothetical protein
LFTLARNRSAPIGTLARPMPDNVDPTMRVLMWLAAEKRQQSGYSREEVVARVRDLGGNVSGPTLSRFERGERWINASQPVLRAYANLGGLVSPAFLWEEAIRITRRILAADAEPDFLGEAADDVEDAMSRLDRLRALERDLRRAG